MLTDEEKRAIREKVSKSSGELHFDLMLYASEIERAALAKAGEQEPVGYTSQSSLDIVGMGIGIGNFVDENLVEFPIPLYSAPLPAQSIPEGWQLVPVEPTVFMCQQSSSPMTAKHIYKAMLSASPKP